jgi:uncharacterized protein (DUF1015 family)
VTDVSPFRALRYDPKRVELSRVIAPPYDVVSPSERLVYWDRDPHNAIRLELTREAEAEAQADYADAAERFAAWQREGVLVRDAAPCLYVLRQRFEDPLGRSLERTGFFAALRIEDYEARIVRPHERTLRGPKQDRLRLLRAARSNLSPVFLLYEDKEGALAPLLDRALEAADAVEARDDAGILHRLAALRDPEAAGAVCRFLAPRPVVIADGHHRYETARDYRDERRREAGRADPEAPFERVLAYFANAYAPGSLLLPIHRVVLHGPAPTAAAWRERLPHWSEREVAVGDAGALPVLLEQLLAPLRDRFAFAADDGSGRLRIFSRPADGEVSIRVIHREVVEGVFGLGEAAVRDGAVAFPKSVSEAARLVRTGGGAVALYLNPLAPEDVFRVTEAGEVLPQKSTYFHPKLPTGLVFRGLDLAERSAGRGPGAP